MSEKLHEVIREIQTEAFLRRTSRLEHYVFNGDEKVAQQLARNIHLLVKNILGNFNINIIGVDRVWERRAKITLSFALENVDSHYLEQEYLPYKISFERNSSIGENEVLIKISGVYIPSTEIDTLEQEAFEQLTQALQPAEGFSFTQMSPVSRQGIDAYIIDYQGLADLDNPELRGLKIAFDIMIKNKGR